MSHYVILDLEMCQVPYGEMRDRFGYANETIQVGAVLLDESYETVDTFCSHVHPEFGRVTPFIENLTGIGEKDVENAPSFEEVMKSFSAWAPGDSVFVSWSDTDRIQIFNEAEAKGASFEALGRMEENWLDCQELFSVKMNNTERRYKLSEALNITAIFYDYGEHDALVDAKNTAMLFKKMRTEPEMSLSPYLILDEDDGHSGLLHGFVKD